MVFAQHRGGEVGVERVSGQATAISRLASQPTVGLLAARAVFWDLTGLLNTHSYSHCTEVPRSAPVTFVPDQHSGYAQSEGGWPRALRFERSHLPLLLACATLAFSWDRE